MQTERESSRCPQSTTQKYVTVPVTQGDDIREHVHCNVFTRPDLRHHFKHRRRHCTRIIVQQFAVKDGSICKHQVISQRMSWHIACGPTGPMNLVQPLPLFFNRTLCGPDRKPNDVVLEQPPSFKRVIHICCWYQHVVVYREYCHCPNAFVRPIFQKNKKTESQGRQAAVNEA
jgi:hypothetical protein